MFVAGMWRRSLVIGLAVGCAMVASTTASSAVIAPSAASSVGGFAFGQLQVQTVGSPGCGTNTAGEPSVHVSKANLVGAGSENGLGGGSQYWRATQVGGNAADPCGLVYSGQPNAIAGSGASGGDIDTAFAPVPGINGKYRIYVASLNLGSVNVATSTDDGATFSQTPVQAGLPLDDREWIAAYGANTSLLSYHDIGTNNINILRSDDGALHYTQISQAIPASDYKAANNELGNLVIDHVNASPTAGGFWAYQSFVAPSSATGTVFDEAFVAVSSNGGQTWVDKPIPCSTSFGAAGLNHNFPNISVAPNGTLFYAVSNDSEIRVASSTDHGNSWTCSTPASTTKRSIFPWIVATSAGEDLVYYGTDGTGPSAVWSVYFAQSTDPTGSVWSNTQLMPVHQGDVCEGGVSCTAGRQLLDDFGVDTDQSGWAHIVYSHDAPQLGGTGTYTGYAVQQSGTRIGAPN